MLFNKLSWRPVLCTMAALSISILAIAYALHADHHQNVVHKHPRPVVRKAAVKSLPIPVKKVAAEPVVRTNPNTGCKQVELRGIASSYTKPLRQLLSEKGISSAKSVELQVEKSHRILKLVVDGRLVKTYVTGISKHPDAPKISIGDKATPTGDYYVCQKNPYSRFYLALKLSYPNISDAQRGLSSGLIDNGTYQKIKSAIESHQAPPMDTRLGGNICIHGGGSGTLCTVAGVPAVNVRDWTAGCMALDNAQMKELFDFIPLGTRVHISA